ncbi:MAG: hypothetical protein ACPIB0_02335 [Akkermansiaceae bacterium]
MMISCLQRIRLMVRKRAAAGFNPDHSQLGRLAGHFHGNIKLLVAGPIQYLVRCVTPLQPKGWSKNCLSMGYRANYGSSYRTNADFHHSGQCIQHSLAENNAHSGQGKLVNPLKRCSSRASTSGSTLRHGSTIIELTLALALLTSIGLVVFKSSLDIMAPRQWILHQNMSDAYLTYEEAYAQRISFEQLTSVDSPWPMYPDSITTEVEIGKLPGGSPIMANVIRTRIPDSNNLPDFGGSGTISSNPSEMQTWQVQSHLSYNIGEQEYVKSRTTIRTQ